MKKQIKALVISLILIIGLAGNSFAGFFSDVLTADVETEQQTDEVFWKSRIMDFEDFAAVISEFPEKCETVSTALDSGTEEEIFSLYEELYEELIFMYDQYSLYYLASSEDITDEYYSEKVNEVFELAVVCEDQFGKVFQNVAKSPLGEAFAAYLDDFVQFLDYDALTWEKQELITREQELINDYYQLFDNEMEEGDYEESFFRQAGEIFMELLDIRNQIALSNGYDNYNDYADDYVYGRVFSASDTEKLKSVIRQFGGDYQLYYFLLSTIVPEMQCSDEELVELLGQCVEGISGYTDEAYRILTEKKLYSIGPEMERIEGAYTTALFSTEEAFIFNHTWGTQEDLSSMVHEFGHFTDFIWNTCPNPVFYSGSLDISEIHSTGLQVLAIPNFDKVLGEDELVGAYVLSELLACVSDGCLYDEWQREVYSHPDWTLEEINQCFEDVMEGYGEKSMYKGRDWMLVSHNFESPLYYISYAVSAIASLQIWEQSLINYDKAVTQWENIISHNAYICDYEEVLEDAGLLMFTDVDMVADVIYDAYDYIVEQTDLERRMKEDDDIWYYVTVLQNYLGIK